MVVQTSFSTLLSGGESSIRDVIFVVECTANLGAYLDVIKNDYILPTLEHFSGGPPEEVDCGHDSECTFYSLVLFYAADCVPSPATNCFEPTASTYQFLEWLKNTPFHGGAGEGCSLIAEGLATAAQAFDDLKTLRGSSVKTQKHCILIANSPPYQSPSQESCNYSGYVAEDLAGLLAERGINLSVMAPRKIPELYRLHEKGHPDVPSTPPKDYTKDSRHCVLLRGFHLQQRSHSPVITDQIDGNSQGMLSPKSGGVVYIKQSSGDQAFKVPTSQDSSQQQFGQRSNVGGQIRPVGILPTQVSMGGRVATTATMASRQQMPPEQAISAAHEILNIAQSQGQKLQTQGSATLSGMSQSGNMMSQPGSAGNVMPQSGNMISQSGNMISQSGNMISQSGNMMSQSGNMISQQGNMMSQNGMSQSGGVSQVQTKPIMSQMTGGMRMSQPPQMGGGPMGGSVMADVISQGVNNINPGAKPMGTVAGGHMTGGLMGGPGGQLVRPGSQMLPTGGQRQMTGPRIPGGQMMGLGGQIGQKTSENNTILQQQMSGGMVRMNQPMDNVNSMNTGFPGPPSQTSQAAENADMFPSLESQQPRPQMMRQQAKHVWTGAIEWHEKAKPPAVGEQTVKTTRSLACHVSHTANVGEQEIDCTQWPNKLTMMHLPQTMLTPIHHLFRNSKILSFKFGNQDMEALKSLYRLTSSGLTGCIHLPAIAHCDIRVIMLLYSPKKKEFMGIVPNDQVSFLQSIKTIINNHKYKQAQQTHDKFKVQQMLQDAQSQQQQQPMSTSSNQFNQVPGANGQTSQMGSGMSVAGIGQPAQKLPQTNVPQSMSTLGAPSMTPQSSVQSQDLVEQERIRNMQQMQVLQRSLAEVQAKEIKLKQISQQQQHKQILVREQRLQLIQQQQQQQQQQQLQQQQQQQQSNQQQLRMMQQQQLRQQQMMLQQQQRQQGPPLQQRMGAGPMTNPNQAPPQGIPPGGMQGQSATIQGNPSLIDDSIFDMLM